MSAGRQIWVLKSSWVRTQMCCPLSVLLLSLQAEQS